MATHIHDRAKLTSGSLLNRYPIDDRDQTNQNPTTTPIMLIDLFNESRSQSATWNFTMCSDSQL